MSLIRKLLFYKNIIPNNIPKNPLIYSFFKRFINIYDGDNNSNMYTNGEMHFLRNTLKNCAVVFDIGANKGQWTKLALNINKNLNIHCFEPSEYTFNRLMSNNFPSNVVCYNIGLSSAKREQFLYILEKGSGLNSLYLREGIGKHNHKFLPNNREKIQLDTLDNYCRKNAIKEIVYLKIDAEGHELEVLKGGLNLIKNNQIKIIQFEYGGCFIDAHVFLKDIFDLFAEFDYQFYKIFPNCVKSVKQYYQKFDNFQYQNWLIIKKGYRYYS